ncbi:TRAM domain-containing protein [Candidatus Woesearchaeota archaeon]|nr:TRAM domain-containing protein [Candidatus Woesearchaeota archaeon]
MNEQTPPVNVGDTYDVEIESVGGKGDGIARIKGFVLFVPKVKKGDQVKIKVTKVLPKVGFAEVVGKAEFQPRPQKFATVTEKEMAAEEEVSEHYEDTENFGEEE